MTVLVPARASPPDFSRRSSEPEWLDGAGADAAQLESFLRDLARFNGAMFGYRPVIAWLARAIDNAPNDRPLTLLDVGCGYGDLLRAIQRWAMRRGVRLRLIGLDLSPETIRIARAASTGEIEFRVGNVFDFVPWVPVDFMVSSLLTHHLSDVLIVDLVRRMEAIARRGWLICDLQRHPVPYYFIALIGRMTRLDRRMIADGRTSVARSLTRSEWCERLAEAGLGPEAVRLRWFLFRFVIDRLKGRRGPAGPKGQGSTCQ